MSAKRLFDIITSMAGLAVLWPLFAVIAVGIRVESPGPAFFTQERVGYGGKPFRIIKFRTMQSSPNAGALVTVGKDPRITGLGRLLRKFKIDELPQLVNVLKGDMSLVGPRPEVPTYMACYTPEQQEVILSTRPGITDFAAIEFSDESDILARSPDPHKAYIHEVMPKKYELYKRYVEQRTFLLDLQIIARTLAKIVKH